MALSYEMLAPIIQGGIDAARKFAEVEALKAKAAADQDTQEREESLEAAFLSNARGAFTKKTWKGTTFDQAGYEKALRERGYDPYTGKKLEDVTDDVDPNAGFDVEKEIGVKRSTQPNRTPGTRPQQKPQPQPTDANEPPQREPQLEPPSELNKVIGDVDNAKRIGWIGEQRDEYPRFYNDPKTGEMVEITPAYAKTVHTLPLTGNAELVKSAYWSQIGNHAMKTKAYLDTVKGNLSKQEQVTAVAQMPGTLSQMAFSTYELLGGKARSPKVEAILEEMINDSASEWAAAAAESPDSRVAAEAFIDSEESEYEKLQFYSMLLEMNEELFVGNDSDAGKAMNKLDGEIDRWGKMIEGINEVRRENAAWGDLMQVSSVSRKDPITIADADASIGLGNLDLEMIRHKPQDLEVYSLLAYDRIQSLKKMREAGEELIEQYREGRSYTSDRLPAGSMERMEQSARLDKKTHDKLGSDRFEYAIEAAKGTGLQWSAVKSLALATQQAIKNGDQAMTDLGIKVSSMGGPQKDWLLRYIKMLEDDMDLKSVERESPSQMPLSTEYIAPGIR